MVTALRIIAARNRRRNVGTVLVVAFAALVASVAVAAPADAHAGAVANFTGPGSSAKTIPVNNSGYPKYQFKLADNGYAYNAHTKPVQTIMMKFYADTSDGYCDSEPLNLLHTTAQYVANQSDPTDAKKIHATTNNIGWSYSTGWRDGSWADIADWRIVRLYVHDKGESGGWVLARQWCLDT
jgi:hypothetical protein